MKIKIISLCMAMLMLSGCGILGGLSNKTQNEKLVMAKTDTTEIKYEGYNLYLDVVAGFGKMTARENLAFVAMVTKDLAKEGAKAPDREAFEKKIAPVIEEMLSDEHLQKTLALVYEATGFTKERLIEAAKNDYWPQDVYQAMGDYFEAKSPTATNDAQDPFDEYSEKFLTRADFSNPDILVKLDGEDIAFTDVDKDYIEYSAIMARAATIENIATRHLVVEDMKTKGITIDTEGFAKYKEDIIAEVSKDEVYAEMFPKVLASLKVTEEEYYKQIDSYLMLGYAGDAFSKMIEAEYTSMPAETKPESIDDYLSTYFESISKNLELHNITGKKGK